MSVAIRGLGAVCAIGHDLPSLARAVRAGEHGLGPVRHFDVAPFAPVSLGGCVNDGAGCVAWAVRAVREAFLASGVEAAPARIAVVAGTTEGDDHDIPGVARAVAAALGARGPQLTLSTACTSSANAIGLGKDLLDRGDADVVVAGGAERLAKEMYAGFHRLGVLAVEPCRPFGDAFGTTLGEGAGFVVLTREAGDARAHLAGYGLSSDAWHETSPEPRGAGVARAIEGALRDARLAPAAIDYVNAHGTGTAANDDAEWRGVTAALGARAAEVPISASKSLLGHAQGAAGVLELIVGLLCAAEGTVPPTLRVGRGRPGGPPDPVATERPRPHHARAWLSSSAAFGGANAVLCVQAEPAPSAPRARRPVVIAGLGRAEVPAGARREDARWPELAGLDPRGTDPSGRACCVAATRALADAGLKVSGALRDRAGVFAGATRVSPESVEAYRASIERGGLARCSAAAFARLVLHGPTGLVSRRLALRGPTTTLAGGGLAGMLAVAYAARTLAHRDDADVMLALGFDERRVGERDGEGADEPEGAACVALRVGGDGPRVLGVGLTGPNDREGAVARALADAGRSRCEVTAWRVEEAAEHAPSLASAALVAEAAEAARAGGLIVVALADDAAACALVIGEES